MATKILMIHGHLVRYQRQNSRSLSYFHRYLSNQNRGSSQTANTCQTESSAVENTDTEPDSKWLNIKAGIFGPKDSRLQLPGDVGFSQSFEDPFDYLNIPLVHKRVPDGYFETVSIRVDNLLSSLQEKEYKLKMGLQSLKYHSIVKLLTSFEDYDDYFEVEFKYFSCPKIIRRDFQSLFPNQEIEEKKITVVTMCQKAKHDMSGWSLDIEVEREFLMSRFVECAKYICKILKDSGYWADFIDPSSGRPALGSFTSSTFFETDERFRHFGLEVEDLGCCKVISHPVWKKNVFVGTFFTDAPRLQFQDLCFPDLIPPKK